LVRDVLVVREVVAVVLILVLVLLVVQELPVKAIVVEQD
jgi:hypothetical protein